MAKYVVNDTDLTAVANAIRSKGNTSETLTWPTGFKNAIDNISFDVEDACIKTTDFDDVIKVDDAAALNARDIVMKIEPVQDLHGYDNPWPAGGGVNLLDPSTATLYSSGTYGFTFVWDSTTGALTISGTYTNSGSSATFRVINVPSAIRSNNIIGFSTSTNFKLLRWQVDEDTIVCQLYNMVLNNTYNITIYPVVYEGSTTPTSWTPYSNICPITGWTEATVAKTGKNLLEMFGKSGSNMLSKNTFVKTGTYTASASGISGNYATYVRKATTEGSFSGDIIASKVNQGNITFTLEEDTDLIIQWYTPNDSSADLTGKTFQLELGSTATDYEPYNGNTYDFTFLSEAGTVYGGTLDVTTGVLTVDRAKKILDGTEAWSIGSYSNYRHSILDMKNDVDINTVGLYCESLKAIAFANRSQYTIPDIMCADGLNIEIRNVSSLGIDSVESLKTWLALNNVVVFYPLATPIAYQLTPQEITMLKGTNVVFSTTGKTKLKYFTEAFEPLAEELGL